MYIDEIIIGEFGAISGKTIRLGTGFNLITGANESGKSTLCAFIRYVFYGFSDLKDREKNASFETGNSFGSLIINSENRRYRIERRDSGRIRDVTVYREEDGSVFSDWKNEASTPGEYFLGIPSSLYSRSLYVSQDTGARLEKGSAEAVSNLLISGDEAINLKRAKVILEKSRRSLKLNRGNGGKIYETERCISELKEEKESALSAKTELTELRAELRTAEKEIETLTSRAEKIKANAERIKAGKILIYLNEKKKVEEKLGKCGEDIKRLKQEYSYRGFIPDEGYIRELEALERDLKFHRGKCADIERQLQNSAQELSVTPPKGYQAYLKLGKREAVISEYKKHQSSYNLFNVLMISAGVISFMAIIALVLSALKIYEGNTFLYVILVCGAITGIFSAVYRAVPARKLKRLLNLLYCDDYRTPEKVCDECDEYEEKLEVHSGYLCKSLEDTLRDTENILNRQKALLKKWNRTDYLKAEEDYLRYTSEFEKLTEEARQCGQNINILDAYLEPYTDREIENAESVSRLYESVPIDESFDEADLSDTEIRLKEATDRKNGLDIRLAQTEGKHRDIDDISFEIEAEEKKLEEYNTEFMACQLALDSLSAAEQNIRKTVYPYLSRYSGEYFSRITGGKYAELRIDNDMNLSYIGERTKGVTDSMYLSGGSADLAWLCLRLALHRRLSENFGVPLILDESLVYFDDTRLSSVISELSEISLKGIQILLFSASSREKELLKTGVKITELF